MKDEIRQSLTESNRMLYDDLREQGLSASEAFALVLDGRRACALVVNGDRLIALIGDEAPEVTIR
jgi:hypothetical protein